MAFSISVVSPLSKPERISRSLGIFAGQVTIASYASTLVKCTGITKFFVPTGNGTTGLFPTGILSCDVDGPSNNGYIVRWDATTGAFRCYSPTGSGIIVNSAIGGAALNYTSGSANVLSATSAVGTLLGTVATEAAANAAIGTFNFVAVGFVRA